MKKWIIPLLIGIIVGWVIGILLGLFFLDIVNIKVNQETNCGVLKIVYYLVAPIGVLATFMAGVVALWGNELENFYFVKKVNPL